MGAWLATLESARGPLVWRLALHDRIRKVSVVQDSVWLGGVALLPGCCRTLSGSRGGDRLSHGTAIEGSEVMTSHTKIGHATRNAGHSDQALSRTQREQLRFVLETKRKQLLRTHEERDQEASDEDVGPSDTADVAEAVVEDRLRAALDEHDRGLLGEITHALSKFENGTYGLSEAGGRPIPFERLLAVPWARYAADEASRMEQQVRSQGKP